MFSQLILKEKVKKIDVERMNTLIKDFINFFLKNPYATYNDFSHEYDIDSKNIDKIRKTLQNKGIMKSKHCNGSDGKFLSEKMFDKKLLEEIFNIIL